MRQNRWGYQRHHPLQAVRNAVGAVYILRKKERSHPLQVRRIAPSPKKQPKDYAGFTYWSSRLRPNDYWSQQPKKKQRSHPLPVFDALDPLTEG